MKVICFMIMTLKKYYIVVNIFLVSMIPANAQYKRLSHFRYTAASVLMNTNIIRDGKSVNFILLGREAGGLDRGMWDDFGGACNAGEHDSLHTAAREAHEETIAQDTLGWTVTQMQNYISLQQANTSHVLAVTGINKKKQNCVVYVTQFPSFMIKQLCMRFFSARESASLRENKEKDGLALVRWCDLMAAIKNKKDIVQASVFKKKGNKFSRIKKTITLRPFLCAKLQQFATGARFMQSADHRVRFYTYR